MNSRVILTVLCISASAAHAQSPPLTPLPPVEVRGTTPLSGTAVPRDHVPANVQIATGGAITERGVPTLTDDGTGVERFLSPGPPFGVFAGARLRF